MQHVITCFRSKVDYDYLLRSPLLNETFANKFSRVYVYNEKVIMEQ